MTVLSEKLCLEWTEFQQNFSSSFQELWKENYLSDITLVCDDNQQIEAHKIILTTCSPLFKTMLKKNKHSHPMIFMRGIKSKHLMLLLEFMYLGETNVFQEDLNDLLKVGEELQVKGIAGGSHSFNQQELEEFKAKDFIKREFTAQTQVKNEGFETKDLIRKVKPVAVLNTEDIQNKISSMMEKTPEGKYKCKHCGKISQSHSSKRNIQMHIETHLTGIRHPCTQCKKVFKTSNSHTVHVRTHHRENIQTLNNLMPSVPCE